MGNVSSGAWSPVNCNCMGKVQNSDSIGCKVTLFLPPCLSARAWPLSPLDNCWDGIVISSCLRLGKAEVLSVFFFNKRRRDYVTFFNERSVVESSIVGNFCVMPFSPSTVKRAVLHAHQLWGSKVTADSGDSTLCLLWIITVICVF